MLFSLCNWGEQDVLSWGAKYGQMYRIQMDHIPFWSFPPDAAGMGYGQGTANIIEYVATINQSRYIQQYGWLDPDFLETLFIPTMPFTESRTEYAFWALWSAPLIIATDLRNLTAQKKSIIMNPEVIAIDQDTLWTAGERLSNYTKSGERGQVWGKPLANGDWAVILYNPQNNATVTITVTWDQIKWPKDANVLVRDLWARSDLGAFKGSYAAQIKPHDQTMLRVKKIG